MLIRLYLTRKETIKLRDAGRILAVLASLTFAYLTISQGPPQPPEGPGLERDVQYAFVVVGLLATLIAWWLPLPGGALLFVSGVVLGVAAAMRYSEETALAVALLYVIPALLFVSTWASRRPLFVQIMSLTLVVALMAYGGVEARQRHATAFGPAHPQSELTLERFEDVEWIWTGGVTSTHIEVKAQIAVEAQAVRLVASRHENMSSALQSEPATVNSQGIASMTLDGLEPAAKYFYAVEVDGRVDAYRRGSVRTFPVGPASFTFAVGACARTGSNGLVFEAIAAADPLLYVVTGDFHYENIMDGDGAAFRRAYEKNLTSPAQSALYNRTPVAYVWDDHDFGGNNSDASSPSRETAQASYQQYVPHYPLDDDGGAIYQAFSIGRVRFLLTDTRSMRNKETRDDGTKSLLGAAQLEWLKQEIAEASRTHALVVWISAVPWIGDFSDSWGGFPQERREIANFLADNRIGNLLMLAGDAHMVAIDDGTNTAYSDDGTGSFPLLHAGALDRPGSVKGGPYSHGAFPGAGQFGLVDVQDDGESIRVRLSGHTWDGRQLTSYEFTPS